MAVTLKDVAERAGVSRSAVSRTFTDGASVSARTRAKVEQAADALGYAPNALASSLTTGRTKLIGLIANNFHNPLILEVFDLFTRGLQDRGLRPLLVNLSGATDPAASVRMLRQYSVDGVIVAPFDDQTAVLQHGLAVSEGEGMDARDGRVGHGKGCPVVTGNTIAGGEGQEIIVSLRVAGRCEGDGAKGARAERVSGVVVLENLDV